MQARNPAPFEPHYARCRRALQGTPPLDLAALIEPLVALPDSVVSNSVPVDDVAGQKIDQAFIGSCANGTLDDLADGGARRGRAPGGAGRAPSSSRPARKAIFGAALKAGYVETLLEAGAVVTPATCGACVGGHMGVLGPGEVCITASTRNFKGRMGDPSARIYMASPATVAASALAGRDRPCRRILAGRRAMISGRVWKFGDDINTDLMLPGPLSVRRAEAAQARAVFPANRPGWVSEVRQGDTIVGGRNFGMGSSRPAARSLRNIGVGFLLAESINGLFFRNAVNFGLLALECPGVSAAFAEGDTAELSLESWSVRNPRTGQTLSVQEVPARLLEMMLQGGVYPLLAAQGLIASA